LCFSGSGLFDPPLIFVARESRLKEARN